MAVLRINKTKDYTVISNYHLRETEMSLKAKGLLSQMLSLPEGWDYSIEGLVSINKENETSIKSALSELKQFGYLVITKKLPNETDTGRIEYVYDIYEQPYRKQGIEKQGIENLPLENQGQSNTYNKDTDNKNTYYKDVDNKKEKISKKEIADEFEMLWAKYPKKAGKAKALKSYIRARQNGAFYADVSIGLDNYLKQIDILGTKRQFIKDGSTWFNNECWNDEYQTEGKSSCDTFYDNLNKILKESE